MADYQRQTLSGVGARAGAAEAIDEGLRSYMLSVYNYMASGLVITGVVAYVVSNLVVTTNPGSAAAQLGNGIMLNGLGAFLYGPFKFLMFGAILVMIFMLPSRIQTMSVSAVQTGFWVFAALFGLILSSIFLQYTGQSIAQVFFITAAAFGGLSLYGYTTKKDLSGWRSFLVMGLWGLLLAILVSFFFESSALEFAIAVIGVLVFSGLTAYDTQNIKNVYLAGGDSAVMGKNAIVGAFKLYLDFINLFIMLLMLLGNRE